MNPQHTFANFVVGASNSAAYRASRRVATRPAGQPNPLVICGGTGLGKTHLATAIAHELLARRRTRLTYLSTWTLMERLGWAFGRGRAEDVWTELGSAEALIFEDLHLLAAWRHTQERFVRALSVSLASGAQVVLTSQRVPREIPYLNDELRMYLGKGRLVRLGAPDLGSRRTLVERLAVANGFSLPDPVLRFIAERASASFRELEGALVRVGAYVKLCPEKPTVDLARRLLDPLFLSEPPGGPDGETARAQPHARRPRPRPVARPNPDGLREGLQELDEFIHDVGCGRIGSPDVRGNTIYVPIVARDGDRYVLQIRVTEYLARPPQCTFVDHSYRCAEEAWPYPDDRGPFRSPHFICTPPTAEFYRWHPERVYRHGEGSLVNTVGTVFAALHAPEYGGRFTTAVRRCRTA